MKVKRRHPDELGECMECGAPADPVAVQSMSCFKCGSDQIRVYAEDDVPVDWITDECRGISREIREMGRFSDEDLWIMRLASICVQQQAVIDRLLAVTPMAQERT